MGVLLARLPGLFPWSVPHQGWAAALAGRSWGGAKGRSWRKGSRKKKWLVCFGIKHKQERKQLIYLTMFLIITMERQGTLTGLNNPLQIQITQTAASSFIFAFSALTEGLEVDNGEGPHLHCTDLQMQLSKTNILGWVPGEGCWGFVVGKGWQTWLWSVKFFL